MKQTDSNFLPFEQAREFVHSLRLKKIKEWEGYCVSGKKPIDLPPNPAFVYWEEWMGWKDWLIGTDLETLQEDSEKLERYLSDESVFEDDKNQDYLSFEEARKFAHSLKLKAETDWWNYVFSGNRPHNIPITPWKLYENKWKGFDDWLGIESPHISKFLPFEQAREYVRSLHLQNYNDWKKFIGSGKRPSYIPSTPNQTYKERWEGWGDWLGTGRIDTRKRKYLIFDEARKIARNLGLKNQQQWYKFCKTGNKPYNIPRDPSIKYSKDWKGWKDWLKPSDTEIIIDNITLEDETTKALDDAIKNLSSKYLSFEQARNYVQMLQLRSVSEWKKFIKSKDKPSNIPSNPFSVYRDKWKGWNNWLGKEDARTKFLPFDQAHEHVIKLGLKSTNDWIEFCRSGKRPSFIPSTPNLTYKENWKGWGDWLGTGRTRNVKFRPFEHAREYVRSLNIHNQKEWVDFCRSGKKPLDIPTDPSTRYWEKWKGWKDWFGQVFLPFNEARRAVRMLKFRTISEWEKFCKSGNKPLNIPEDPWRVYSMEWKNMDDWLGITPIERITYKTKFSKNLNYLPFKQARDYVRSLKFKSLSDWKKFRKSKTIPSNIPSFPDLIYWEEWKGWHDWLGTK